MSRCSNIAPILVREMPPECLMTWISILAALVLFFSFIGGLKEGVVKSFFSLITLIITIPLTGVSYRLLANILSFLPGEN